jgi:hemoglobin
MADRTIFEAIGGQPAVAAAVHEFYGRVLADPDLAGYFTDVSLARLRAHQGAFIAQALGGPAAYGGRSMRNAHQGHGVTDAAFDRVAGHLAATLSDLGVDQTTVALIIERIAPLRPEIVEGRVAEPVG